jgi:hypothetical protein
MGMTLGMRLEQAEKIVRSKMDVGWTGIRDSSGFSTPVPFHDFKLLVSKDQLHQVSFFWHPKDPDTLLGVANIQLMPTETDKQKNTSSTSREVWACNLRSSGDSVDRTSRRRSRTEYPGPHTVRIHSTLGYLPATPPQAEGRGM